MKPLYSTTTIITFEEYKKLNKAVFKEQSKLLILLYSAIIFFAITSHSFGFMLFSLFAATGSLLLSFYQVKKEYRTNRTLQNQRIHYEFYDTYFLAETSSPSSDVPLFETSTLFNADEQHKLQQYVFIKQRKLHYILKIIAIVLVGYTLFYKNYFTSVLFALMMASFFITLFKKKGSNPFIKVQEQKLIFI